MSLLGNVTTLTQAEQEVLREICRGRTPQEVAVVRGSSWETVRFHLKIAMHKLGVSRWGHAALIYDRAQRNTP